MVCAMDEVFRIEGRIAGEYRRELIVNRDSDQVFIDLGFINRMRYLGKFAVDL